MFPPFAILPMFIVADTFYRFFGLILINMFLIYPYLINEFNIPDLIENFSRTERAYVKIGLNSALPFVGVFLRKLFGFSLLVAGP